MVPRRLERFDSLPPPLSPGRSFYNSLAPGTIILLTHSTKLRVYCIHSKRKPHLLLPLHSLFKTFDTNRSTSNKVIRLHSSNCTHRDHLVLFTSSTKPTVSLLSRHQERTLPRVTLLRRATSTAARPPPATKTTSPITVTRARTAPQVPRADTRPPTPPR